MIAPAGKFAQDAPKPSPEVFAVANSLKANKEIPATARKRPIKRRKLKNADCELDFFFIWRIRWMNFELPADSTEKV